VAFSATLAGAGCTALWIISCRRRLLAAGLLAAIFIFRRRCRLDEAEARRDQQGGEARFV
jgi:hypothetical protein